MSNQKGFVNILVFFLVLAVIGVASYYAVSKKANQPSIPITETRSDINKTGRSLTESQSQTEESSKTSNQPEQTTTSNDKSKEAPVTATIPPVSPVPNNLICEVTATVLGVQKKKEPAEYTISGFYEYYAVKLKVHTSSVYWKYQWRRSGSCDDLVNLDLNSTFDINEYNRTSVEVGQKIKARIQFGLKDGAYILNTILTVLTAEETLAVITDSTTYNSAKEEVDRFVKDIQKGDNFKVTLKTFPIGTNKETIKSYLKGLYFNNNLSVVIFIGEIPTAEYFPGTVSQVKVPTDSYYYDAYDKCPFDEQNQAFNSKNKFCDPIALPFIISRITSPLKGANGIQLIKNYLNKNHAFRSGALYFDQKALLYPQTLNDVAIENRPSALDNVIDNFKRFFAIDTLPLYGESELVVADWESTTSNPSPNEKFLEELSKNHQYAFVDAHGYPQGHLYNINKDTIKTPNVFYADFYSCSVGKFTEDDYVAGQYLFKGNTLFVKASSDLLFKPIGVVESQKLFLLKQGQSILETLRSLTPSFIIQNFGDPTLKMPQGAIQKNSGSKISLSQEKIDFGEIKVCKDILNYRDCKDPSGVKKITFNISNRGSANLGFFLSVFPDFSFETINNSHPLDGYDKPYQVTFDNVSYNVGVDQTIPFTINMLGIVKGIYTGKISIYNSDPRNPIIKVPFSVKITD